MTHALRALAAAALLAAAPTSALAAGPAAAPAPVDEVAEARSRYQEGARRFRAGRYREAIDAFEAAYRLKPHGAIHFNVAQCRERLGEWPAALRAYQDYLRELPEARDRAAVRAAIGRIEQRLAAAGVQALLVYSDPPGAALRLDGKPLGRTPFHITLPSAVYRLELEADGFAPEAQEVQLGLAASKVIEVVLRPQGRATAPAVPTASAPAPNLAAAPAGAPPGAAAVGTAAAAPPADLVPAPLPTPSPLVLPPPAPPLPAGDGGARSGWTVRRALAWGGAVAALAAAGAAVTYGVDARDNSAQLRDGTRRTSEQADALARDARSKARTANVLYGLAGAAGIASGTLFVLEGRF